MPSNWKNRFSESLQKKEAVVVWREPNSDEIHCIQTDHVRVWDGKTEDSQFLFAPFNQKKYPILSFGSTQGMRSSKLPIQQNSSSKEEYENWVDTCKRAISDGYFSKLVGARVQSKRSETFDILAHFDFILSNHGNAFCYLLFSEETGVWSGASPELLLELANDDFRTVALAGTQKADDIAFGNKEDQEQEFVVDYIREKLAGLSSQLSVSEKSYHRSGHLIHLQSSFAGKVLPQTKLVQILETLHPTPAVAGIPKEEAINFIEKGEGFDRTYYSGFLGPVTSDHASLFVNLRCLQWAEGQIIQFAGAGLTIDSDPEKEWQETEEKLKVVAPLS